VRTHHPFSFFPSLLTASCTFNSFDEVHFGKFASYYLRHSYYFDVHPPLGKLLFAAVGFFIGYDGAFDYKDIGLNYYEHRVPFVYFRGMAALFGSLTVPVMYAIMKESFYHTPVCFLVAMMCALGTFWKILVDWYTLLTDTYIENGLITQSRFILLDSSLLFFQVLGMYCWIRFFKLRKR
jgi:dolichyl-phosphate-mannose-protein mannosyltransferase